jgi:peptidoglycan/xylan/chitin deacetylase (PgdA/CDA1 family)
MITKYKYLVFHFLVIILTIKTWPAFSQAYDSGNLADPAHEFVWPEGKKMAISLTFDDARLSQPDKGIPLLDKYGVKATFYISPGSMLQRIDEWIKAASNGHEIGNHSVLHPCSGNFTWSRNKALEDYTLERMKNELDSASRLINAKLGVYPVSFAYPCGQTFIGRGINTQSYVPLVAMMFESGRGWLNEAPNDPAYCDFAQLNATELDGKSFDQVMKLIETAKPKGYWLILAGHEMNVEGNQTSRLETLEALCKYATDPANGIWIDNVHNIASYIKQKRKD